VLATGQIATASGPFINLQKAAAAGPGAEIQYNNFEGEIAPQNSDNWTNGNISGYKEGDTVRFRVDLDSDAGSLAGHLFVGFTSDPSCRFFRYQNPTNVSLDFNRATNTIDSGSGFSAALVGLSQNGSDAVADFSLASTAALSVRLNFTLQLDDNAAACATGSSQHVETDTTSGDVKNSGNKALPIPSTAVAPVTDITVIKSATATASLGGAVSYTITVTNLDLTPAASVTSSDNVPAGIVPNTAVYDVDPTAAGGTGSCVIAAQNVSCSLGTLAGNDGNSTAPEPDKAVITITGTVSQDPILCSTILTNTVTVATTTLESNLNNNSAQASTNINPCLGTLTVIKHVINDNGGLLSASAFNVHVKNGSTDVSGSPSVGTEAGTAYSVGAGTYTISEDTPPTGYSQTSIVCNGQTTDTVVVSLNTSNTCTITNDDIAPLLTVTKHVVTDNGGSAAADNFTMNVTATNPSDSSFPGDESGTTITLDAGSYSVDEDAFAGYAKTLGANCSGSIAVGEHKFCTITNDDIAPSLTLNKIVSNLHGGTVAESAWTLTATGPTNLSGAGAAGSADVVSGPTFAAGTYTLSESTGPQGYSASLWTCTNGVIVTAGQITLANGQTSVCTITNSDVAPVLQLMKQLINDNGGTFLADDWILTAQHAEDTPIINEQGTSSDEGVTAITNSAEAYAGLIYTLSEFGPDGYTPGTWSCDGGTLVGSDLTLSLGEAVICTITNDDNVPSLHLRKLVTNDNGGTATLADFTLTANGTGSNDISGTSPVDSGATLKADSFALSETGPTGYTASSWVCVGGSQNGSNITLLIGQEATCTVTNNDNTPTLTLVKQVTNNNGGTAEASAWTLTAAGPTGFSGAGPSVSNGASFDAGTYNLSESGPGGYTASDWVCVGGTQNDGDTVTVGLGESATCTITNDDQQAYIIVDKTVVNDNGGTKSANDFNLKVDGNAVLDEDVNPVNPGTHTVSESNLSGYVAGTWGGDCAADATVTVALGETKTCTITNNDIAPVLTLHKIVVSDNPAHEPSDWTLTATPTTGTTISGNGEDGVESVQAVSNMMYTLSELNNSDGTFDASDWTCDDVKVTNSQIQLHEGADVTCTITNTERGSVTIVKDADPDSDQPFKFTGDLGDPSDEDGPNFTLVDDGLNDTTDRRTFTELTPGTYTVTEPSVKGWSLDEINCTDEEGVNVNNRNVVITLQPGENVTCTFVNTRDTGEITVTKITDPSPDPDEENFTIRLRNDTETNDIVHESVLSDGQSDTYSVETNDYNLDEEVIPDGWDLADAYCTRDEGETTFDPRVEGLTVEKDDDVACFFVNEKRAEVKVTKYNDFNRNGEKDADEPVIPDWEFNLSGQKSCDSVDFRQLLVDFIADDLCQPYNYDKTQLTGADGTTTFTDVLPGVGHELTETIPDGWHFSDMDCDNQDGDFVYPNPGQTVECFVGNYHDVVLNLTKSNDRPAPTVVGDTVTYTLIASLDPVNGALFDTTVADLPPEGFDYIPGSWTANSNLRGDLKAANVTTEPTYGSPGTWILGDMLPGEIVTLTYKTKIALTASDGTYPDVAFAQGCALPGGEGCGDEEVVLSNVHNATDPFAATQVVIRSPQVLGASTTVLVDTGTSLAWAYALVSAILTGLGIATAKRKIPTKGGVK
jgi:uncharacterized repeat protein (TIGR01451 family)